MKRNFPFSAFLFLIFFIGIVHGEVYYSGSTYQIPFSKCSRLNITATCSLPIAENEYYFDGCRLTELNTYQALWSCECHDNYILNFRINPRAKNSCTFTFEAIYPISIPPTHEVERHHYYGTIVKNYTVVYNESYKKLYEYYSNLSQKLMTKVQVLESEKQTYQNLVNYLKGLINRQNATMEELGQEIERLAEERQELERRWLLSIAVLVFFLVLSSMVFLARLKRKNQQIGKLLVAFRKRE